MTTSPDSWHEMTALALGLGIRFAAVYVRSEKNFSDGPSRGLPIGVAEETGKAHAERAKEARGAEEAAVAAWEQR